MAAENKPEGVHAREDSVAARDGLAANRALWKDLAEFHGTDPGDRSYDVQAFLAGGQTLRGIERELAGDVAGKDLLHLQCHFGMDTLNWARLGARVTGVDFSSKAIARARTLAERAGLVAEFVEADTQRLPDALAGRFDLVVATYGVLSWIGDLGAWMGGAATALRPGGRLVVVDLHPVFQTVLTFDPFVADWPYGGGTPQHDAMTGTYAHVEAPAEPKKSSQYPYSVGEIVTAAASAGLVVERLGEHTETETDGRHILPQGPDGLYRFPFSDTYLLILYSLSAALPPAPDGHPGDPACAVGHGAAWQTPRDDSKS
ncbi:class I SAM-dependent methyltransferase [Streptomyces sp. NPDC006476]|uniref:class I SAM-dependent methyltransferase n=1 Tax=Streptomyces sp. NPDC006476 TaxID=3157175 RepID=UPI0033A92474